MLLPKFFTLLKYRPFKFTPHLHLLSIHNNALVTVVPVVHTGPNIAPELGLHLLSTYL